LRIRLIAGRLSQRDNVCDIAGQCTQITCEPFEEFALLSIGCQPGEELAVLGFREKPFQLTLQVFHGAHPTPIDLRRSLAGDLELIELT